MYWNERIECMSRDELKHLQLTRLQATVERVYQNVAPYRKAMDEKGLKPQDIKSLDDVKYLPFTTKYDLRDNYPYGWVSAPMSEIVHTHASSGTTGKPTVVCHTQKDVDNWGDLVARGLVMAGGTKNDICKFALAMGYSLAA